jgi:amino acid transporter
MLNPGKEDIPERFLSLPTWTISAFTRPNPHQARFNQFGKQIYRVRRTVAHWVYSLSMLSTGQNLRLFSLICILLCAVTVVAVFACLSAALLVSIDAEQLYRIWRAVRFSVFAFVCFFLAMGFVLDAVSRRTPQVRKKVPTSKNAKRIAMTVLVSSIAIVFFYPPRPFVYSENGRWIQKSKAGTWEVSRDVAINSYKRNITWDCMTILPLVAVLSLVAAAPLQAKTLQKPR